MSIGTGGIWVGLTLLLLLTLLQRLDDGEPRSPEQIENDGKSGSGNNGERRYVNDAQLRF